MKASILWGMAGGGICALLVLVMFTFPKQTSLVGGILAGVGAAAAAILVARLFYSPIGRIRNGLGIVLVLAVLAGGGFLAYQAFCWGEAQSLIILKRYVPQLGWVLMDGVALGGTVGAVIGNFRLLSRAYNRVVGLLTSLAVALTPLGLFFLTGFLDLAFKPLK